ncbi:MAG: phosphoribosylaminoimidazolesuccinocarboxamide synthase [Symbiobacteriia bacterium]
MEEVLLECPDLGLPRLRRGKVREVFALDEERLLIVATDRLSAFDVVFPDGIPGKGRVLTQLSLAWFRATERLAPNHLLTSNLAGLPLPPEHLRTLADRAMVVRRAMRIDVEAVARGYLAGSGWKEYQAAGTVCGIPLPAGLLENQQLASPIFTPALKRDEGHDENASEAEVAAVYGPALVEAVRRYTLQLYTFAASRALAAGIIIADCKLEFGLFGGSGATPAERFAGGGQLIVIDEMFTPDASRFWPAGQYQPGRPQESLDKQPLRDWADRSGWDKCPPAPRLSPELIQETARRYQEALDRLTPSLA